MNILIIKSLHIIGFVCWFSGLFYIVRLFIYDVEAVQKDNNIQKNIQHQLRIMQRRLWYGITYPSMFFTLFWGIWLLYIHIQNFDRISFWLFIKLIFVVLLILYHFICGMILNQLKINQYRWTSMQLRLWNELATFFLVVIIFLAVLKNGLSAFWLTGIMIIFSMVLFLSIRLYKYIRNE